MHNKNLKAIGIIPARYASSRLPGKPLVNICGKTMIQRVYQSCQQSALQNQVWVATDNQNIANTVRQFGGKVVLTSTQHQSGTSRCAEALQKINAQLQPSQQAEIVVNIQGDEPFIAPQAINQLINCFSKYKNVQIATLIRKIQHLSTLQNPNRPKVVLNAAKQAMYFSRYSIPYHRAHPAQPKQILAATPYYEHVGIYAFNATILPQLVNLPPAPTETAEALEQLRWLYHHFQIQTETTTAPTLAVDTPEDVEKAKQYAKQHNL